MGGFCPMSILSRHYLKKGHCDHLLELASAGMHGLSFSLPDLGRFHPYPECESMSKHGNKY